MKIRVTNVKIGVTKKRKLRVRVTNVMVCMFPRMHYTMEMVVQGLNL